MKRWIHAATAPEIIDNNQIQVGLKWYSDGFTYEITDVSPDRKTCTMKETWINEDNGKPMKKIHECKIAQDEKGQEFCYDVNYEDYAFNENDPEGYSWWARKYAVSADNYPFDYESITNKYSGYEDDKVEAASRNNEPSENKYGFEVYAKNPEVEFTDAHWKKMAELRKKGKFYDSDLSRAVDDKLYELQENAGDDVLSMYDRMQEDRVTDDEYWAGYHAIAEWLKLK